MCLAPVIRLEGPSPKGQESSAQGLPWVSRNKQIKALRGQDASVRTDNSDLEAIRRLARLAV
jgi:hypothetical protein